LNAAFEQGRRQGDGAFPERLENILNRQHELYRLAGLIDWAAFEQEYGKYYSTGKGRPCIPLRLLVGLSYLGHAYGLSDEAGVGRSGESVLAVFLR